MGGDDADVGIDLRHAVRHSEAGQVLVARGAGRRPQDSGGRKRRRQGQAGRAGHRRRGGRPRTRRRSRTRTIKQLSTSQACRTASSTRSRSKDALAAKVPFVVTFATPAYCQSRTCGPVVDVVSAVRKREAGSNVRFIHVEVYQDNDPAKGENQWFKEWHLPIGAVDVPRRARRQDPRAVRGHGVGERARRGREETPAPVARNGYAQLPGTLREGGAMADVLVTTEWLAAHLGRRRSGRGGGGREPGSLRGRAHRRCGEAALARRPPGSDRARHHREGRRSSS